MVATLECGITHSAPPENNTVSFTYLSGAGNRFTTKACVLIPMMDVLIHMGKSG